MHLHRKLFLLSMTNTSLRRGVDPPLNLQDLLRIRAHFDHLRNGLVHHFKLHSIPIPQPFLSVEQAMRGAQGAPGQSIMPPTAPASIVPPAVAAAPSPSFADQIKPGLRAEDLKPPPPKRAKVGAAGESPAPSPAAAVPSPSTRSNDAMSPPAGAKSPGRGGRGGRASLTTASRKSTARKSSVNAKDKAKDRQNEIMEEVKREFALKSAQSASSPSTSTADAVPATTSAATGGQGAVSTIAPSATLLLAQAQKDQRKAEDDLLASDPGELIARLLGESQESLFPDVSSVPDFAALASSSETLVAPPVTEAGSLYKPFAELAAPVPEALAAAETTLATTAGDEGTSQSQPAEVDFDFFLNDLGPDEPDWSATTNGAAVDTPALSPSKPSQDNTPESTADSEHPERSKEGAQQDKTVAVAEQPLSSVSSASSKALSAYDAVIGLDTSDLGIFDTEWNNLPTFVWEDTPVLA